MIEQIQYVVILDHTVDSATAREYRLVCDHLSYLFLCSALVGSEFYTIVMDDRHTIIYDQNYHRMYDVFFYGGILA